MIAAFLFPGQGAQHEGMLHSLPAHAAVRETLAEAAGVLMIDILSLDSESSLRTATGAQLSLFLSGVAVARAMLAEGLRPAAVAGLSVGAFAAAVISGAVPFADALRLVRLRAELMQSSFVSGYGMGVVVGLTERQVADLVASIHTPAEPLYTANINSPGQIAVAGHDHALERLFVAARHRGARRAERLAVSTLSHCPLLEPIAAELAHTARGLVLQPPVVPYVGNIRARLLRQPELILDDLLHNISHGVRWADTMTLLSELGCDLLLSMPPGRILSDLAAEVVPSARTLDMGSYPLDYPLRLLAHESG